MERAQASAAAMDVNPDKRRRANLRVGLTLGAIAVGFFVAAIGTRYFGGMASGMSVIGLVALVLLVLAIAHNVRDR
jgi:hypothetical protein